MKLSSSIYVLKIRAKGLKRSKSITMTEALNEVASKEGYSSWSLLQSKAKEIIPKEKREILNYLNPGDLMLLAARPGLGKTSFSLELLLQAAQNNRKCYFFSLEYTHKDIESKFANLDMNIGQNNKFLKFNFSDEISAEYIIKQVKDSVSTDDVIAIDYLQLLDQKRTNSKLQLQIEKLKNFAKITKCIIVIISQLDRSFDSDSANEPGIKDIRLPNPIDISLFNKIMFLNNGKVVFSLPVSFEIS